MSEKLVRGYLPDARLDSMEGGGFCVNAGWEHASWSLGCGDTAEEAWHDSVGLLDLMQQMLVGYFESDDPDAKPKRNPELICTWCLKRIHGPSECRTHSMMWGDRKPPRSYFYRTHRACDDNYGSCDHRILNLLSGATQ